MVRPVQLDRVENGGPGSDIDPPSGEEPSSHAHFRGPRPPSLPPCSRPSMTSPPGGPKEGPSLTAAARGGRASLRSGRKNACGAVEQKNGIEKERSGKRLHSGRRLENGGMVPPTEQRNLVLDLSKPAPLSIANC